MSNKHKLSPMTQGFTLIELSIVIIIIGFLIAGITAGQSLIQQAKLNSVINEFTQYSNAVLQFQNQYGALPGDIPNATSFWPSLPNAANGDGDGEIIYAILSNPPFEDTYVWEHLALAGLIQGNFTGGLQGLRYIIGENIPASALNPNAGYQLSVNGVHNIILGTTLELGTTPSSSGLVDNGALKPAEAFLIDSKFDDGDPNLGLIRTLRGGDIDANSGFCIDHDSGSVALNTAVLYLLNDDTPSCRIFYFMPTLTN